MVMHDFEDFYVDINGAGVDNELAKIVMRYGKEGKPQNILGVVSSSICNLVNQKIDELEEVKVEDVKIEEQNLNNSHVSHKSHHSHHSQILDRSAGVAALQDATNRSIN